MPLTAGQVHMLYMAASSMLGAEQRELKPQLPKSRQAADKRTTRSLFRSWKSVDA
jgi:hypothetical protein